MTSSNLKTPLGVNQSNSPLLLSSQPQSSQNLLVKTIDSGSGIITKQES